MRLAVARIFFFLSLCELVEMSEASIFVEMLVSNARVVPTINYTIPHRAYSSCPLSGTYRESIVQFHRVSVDIIFIHGDQMWYVTV